MISFLLWLAMATVSILWPASEVAFLHFRLMIFQLILAKHQDMVPYTRDYIQQETERLRALEETQMSVDNIDLDRILKR